MPGVTPILGLRYPTIGDTVDATSFQNLAQDIDSQMTIIDALKTKNTVKGRVYASNTAQAITVATPTILTFQTNQWLNPASFHSTSVNTDQFVIPYTGLYFAACAVLGSGLPSTTTSSLATLTLNGTAYYTVSRDHNGVAAGFNRDMEPQGLFLANTGDVIRCSVTWTGTGVGTISLVSMYILQLAFA